MIQKDLGFCSILITDSSFGPVVPGDSTFTERLKKEGLPIPKKTAWMYQEHGTNINYVGEFEGNVISLFDTDGIWTDQSGFMLVTKTADCVPVLAWNEKEKVVAAIHCGWKGFLKGILEELAGTFEKNNMQLTDFSVFLGPHLRKENFEVQPDFLNLVPIAKQEYLRVDRGKIYFDLTRGVTEILQQIGIKDISDCGINTYNNSDYYSYRGWCHLPEGEKPEDYSTFANAIYLK